MDNRGAVSCLAFLVIAFCSANAYSQGVLGELVKGVGRATGIKPVEDLGRNMDDEHRRIKEHNPDYRAAEEGVTDAVRAPFTLACTLPYQAITNAVIVQCSNWDGRLDGQQLIENAKNVLVNNGIFQYGDFNGIQIRWCPLANAHGMAPDRGRIYLDTSSQHYSAQDLAPLLAHEMMHIVQYRRMGTDNFKCEYSRKFTECGGCQDENHSLEQEAYQFESSVAARIVDGEPQQFLPVQARQGFPSGFGMQACGCWGGPNATPVAPEPRCDSGYVRINYCPGVCLGGFSPYAYICQ